MVLFIPGHSNKEQTPHQPYLMEQAAWETPAHVVGSRGSPQPQRVSWRLETTTQQHLEKTNGETLEKPVAAYRPTPSPHSAPRHAHPHCSSPKGQRSRLAWWTSDTSICEAPFPTPEAPGACSWVSSVLVFRSTNAQKQGFCPRHCFPGSLRSLVSSMSNMSIGLGAPHHSHPGPLGKHLYSPLGDSIGHR